MAKKLTKRKAFNFLRSYYDVLNELNDDKDKLNYLLAIIDKQFLDEDPKGLTFLTNLCYESQRHAIESSVNGWKRANKTDLLGTPITTTDNTLPTTPPTPLGTNPPTTPKEEKEEEEEKEKEKKKDKKNKIPPFIEFRDYAIEHKPLANIKDLKLKYDSWLANGWKDGHDKKILNWKSKILNTLPCIKESIDTPVDQYAAHMRNLTRA